MIPVSLAFVFGLLTFFIGRGYQFIRQSRASAGLGGRRGPR